MSVAFAGPRGGAHRGDEGWDRTQCRPHFACQRSFITKFWPGVPFGLGEREFDLHFVPYPSRIAGRPHSFAFRLLETFRRARLRPALSDRMPFAASPRQTEAWRGIAASAASWSISSILNCSRTSALSSERDVSPYAWRIRRASSKPRSSIAARVMPA